MKVVVFGAGYVGLVTGTVLAYVGHDVTLIDVRNEIVQAIQAGISPIYEPGLDPLVRRAVSSGHLRATTEKTVVDTAAVIYIAVGTPPRESGAPNLSSVEQVARTIGATLKSSKRPVIINKATVPIGSVYLVAGWVSEEARGRLIPGTHFAVVSNPEFLREGVAVYDSLYPDRIVVGTEDDWARERVLALYAPIVGRRFVHPPGIPKPALKDSPVPVVNVDSASSEMIKYAANAFLATKISFANEIAALCELVGADIVRVMAGVGMDSRIGGQFLQAGVGWGGSCFGKDVSALLYTGREHHYQLALLDAVHRVNEGQRLKMVQHLRNLLRPIKGRKVAIWGLAFKPQTDDVRDAPASTIIRELLKLGVQVSAYDPVALTNFRRMYPDLHIQYVTDPIAALHGADALMILTDWHQFQQMDWQHVARALNYPLLIDGRNLVDPQLARDAGFIYRGVGRGSGLMDPAFNR
ncbi:MAG: UDP-glucose 6-dehydrogenase [Sulfobacillus acidophilus]|uniref:UDP-glucose 6-dehydrogenase n=1 Tax=Sulfobacillus acidophilus TaxID=53633 RepID=A0A2T2WNY5_9FIRM|nr:MAG: UDP-glucose 6-dehydrogenase [Sulfobacillus acidophilus]